MKNFILLTYYLVACYQKVSCAQIYSNSQIMDDLNSGIVFREDNEIEDNTAKTVDNSGSQLETTTDNLENVISMIFGTDKPSNDKLPIPPYFDQCIAKTCGQYNSNDDPSSSVCGTDGRTYPNEVYFRCVQGCGLDAEVLSNSPCSETSADTTTPRSPTALPTTTDATSTTVSPQQQRCISNCMTTPEHNPVCGTDGVTYGNEGKLICAIHCGINVELFRRSQCPQRNPPTPTLQTTTAAPAMSAAMSASQQRCLSTCPTTAEHSPVCGTDGITYNNTGQLICAQYCGKDVQLLHWLPCTETQTTVGPIIETVTTSLSGVRLCMVSCPTDPHYNPVCGTNNETFFNLSRLKCAIDCGVNVTLSSLEPCQSTENGQIRSELKIDNMDLKIIKLFLA